MLSRLPLSPSLLAVLQAVASGNRYGFDIIETTGLPSGTVYPALSRLLNDGLASAEWEDPRIAQREKRPSRKYYEVTKWGERVLERAAEVIGERERRGRRAKPLRAIRAKG